MPDEVDPRFDPAFQRGFDPSKHRTRLKPEPPAPASSPPRSRGVISGPEMVPIAAESDTSAAAGAEEAEEDVQRRNPWRLVLLLFSFAALGGAGLVLWKRITADPYGGYGGYAGDTMKIFLDQFSDALLAPLLTGGLLGLCLWFALGALRGPRRQDDA